MGYLMGNNTNELSRRNRKNKKSKKRGRGCWWILLLFLMVLGGIILFFYLEIRGTTDTIHEDIKKDTVVHSSREDKDVDLGKKSPFSILLMGIDTGDFQRVEQGRSDTMMVMTVNPNTDKTSLVSIPRDTYTEIVGRGVLDKINHAYAYGGPAMSINSVQNLLDIPIDYYVSVNMKGIQQIVDAVDGITVTPTNTFSQSGYSFVNGETVHMDGQMALAYSRMRNIDGDYARQGRQREVVLATVNRIASFDTIRNYQSVLQTMEDNVSTNLTFDEMLSIFLNYRSALGNIEESQMSGNGTMMGGIYYEIIPEEEINRVSEFLKGELEINQ